MARRVGKYVGDVTQIEVGMSEDTNYVFIAVAMEATHFKAKGGSYEELEQREPLTGYFYITCSSGANETAIDSLKDAFRLTCQNEFLVDDLLSLDLKETRRRVVFTTKAEEYKGETRIKVAFIDPAGGLKKASEEEVVSAKDEWRRVLGGGQTAARKPKEQSKTSSDDPGW